ncbi:MAG TPA: hypothetical protein P5115_15225 [Spirochaetota bacterium]|nr:hypothetical protein [Bacteroidales bacterium]HRS78503.1 hypothetical protein [Spirochaetota bacterium]
MKPYKTLTESKYQPKRYNVINPNERQFDDEDLFDEDIRGEYMKFDDVQDLLLELLLWLRENNDTLMSTGNSNMDLKRLLSQFMEGI